MTIPMLHCARGSTARTAIGLDAVEMEYGRGGEELLVYDARLLLSDRLLFVFLVSCIRVVYYAVKG